MKLILKDGNEINITRANNMYSYDTLKDGLGCDLNKNAVSTIVIFNPDKSFEQIKEMLSGENREGFRVAYGNTEKDYTGMRVATVTEEIANERSIISIELESSIATEEVKTADSTKTNTDSTKNTKEAK